MNFIQNKPIFPDFSDSKDVAKDIFEDVTDDSKKQHGINDSFDDTNDNAQAKHQPPE